MSLVHRTGWCIITLGINCSITTSTCAWKPAQLQSMRNCCTLHTSLNMSRTTSTAPQLLAECLALLCSSHSVRWQTIRACGAHILRSAACGPRSLQMERASRYGPVCCRMLRMYPLSTLCSCVAAGTCHTPPLILPGCYQTKAFQLPVQKQKTRLQTQHCS